MSGGHACSWVLFLGGCMECLDMLLEAGLGWTEDKVVAVLFILHLSFPKRYERNDYDSKNSCITNIFNWKHCHSIMVSSCTSSGVTQQMFYFPVSPMISARSSFGITVSRGRIYCLGGFSGGSILNTVEKYNPRTNTWHCVQSMQLRRFGLVAATVNVPGLPWLPCRSLVFSNTKSVLFSSSKQ